MISFRFRLRPVRSPASDIFRHGKYVFLQRDAGFSLPRRKTFYISLRLARSAISPWLFTPRAIHASFRSPGVAIGQYAAPMEANIALSPRACASPCAIPAGKTASVIFFASLSQCPGSFGFYPTLAFQQISD